MVPNRATHDILQGGGVSIHIHKLFNFEIRNDLNVNNKDIESLSVEILSDKERNTLFNIFIGHQMVKLSHLNSL